MCSRIATPGLADRALKNNLLCDFLKNISFSKKYQPACRLFFLQSLIPVDGFFESGLSLALDRVLMELEAQQ